MNKIKTLYEDEFQIIQAVEIPEHRRTIQYVDRVYKQEKIPQSIATVLRYKGHSIYVGRILSRNLDYLVNFGSDICLKGKRLSTIEEYIDWYWNSLFENRKSKQHFYLYPESFLKCKNFSYYCVPLRVANKIVDVQQTMTGLFSLSCLLIICCNLVTDASF